MNVEFLDIAERELDDAFKYYDGIYKGLGLRFIAELESSIERIKLHPDAWQKASAVTNKCLLNRFPYSIIYQIKGDLLLVVAIASSHQRPNYWANRTSS
ncbi:type II toxin-antitoxin system RelE/ParE family toxin [Marinomonas shanghaiensis]|uniref:type II toxin-antitoxin system RelE/ParE family toxin n=1 Tax=Marinomonas shanghaiensis TaxID=2202418 RepID=UPI000DBA35C2|nr:type II toxin-antitoxin system RelE/ParE family toxin [Marinomonas shanghaiensis]